MILRRVIAHVRKQEWTAIAIDFVIVVVGVFFGLQVNNWNGERVERLQELAYLARLKDDFVVSVRNEEDDIAFMRRHAGQATVILESLERCHIDEKDQDAFASGLFLLGKVNQGDLVRETVEELAFAGQYRLLRNAELRRELVELVRLVDEWQSVYPQIVSRLGAHLNYVDSQIVYLIDDAVSPAKDIRFDQVRFDLRSLCSDARFSAAVSTARVITHQIISGNQLLVERQRALLQKISEELEARK